MYVCQRTAAQKLISTSGKCVAPRANISIPWYNHGTATEVGPLHKSALSRLACNRERLIPAAGRPVYVVSITEEYDLTCLYDYTMHIFFRLPPTARNVMKPNLPVQQVLKLHFLKLILLKVTSQKRSCEHNIYRNQTCNKSISTLLG